MWKRLFGRSDDSSGNSSANGEQLDWPFPYPLRIVPGVHAFSVLTDMRSNASGALPVLIGGEDDIGAFCTHFEINEDSPECYIEAVEDDPVAWLQQRVMLDPEAYEEIIGEWPAQPQRLSQPVGYLNVRTNRPPRRVAIAEIPTKNSWEIPAYLKFGNWNECPPPEVHVGICKRWHDLYGADIVAAKTDTLEFHVTRPPKTKDAAMELAREQFRYCADIVDQGLGDLSSLAAALLDGSYWFFWWD